MDLKQSGRRQFWKQGAALAGLAAGAIRSATAQTRAAETPEQSAEEARAYGERPRFETTERRDHRLAGQFHGAPYPDSGSRGPYSDLWTPLQDLRGIITPSGLHFTNNHGYIAPDIDPQQYQLLLHGMVDRSLIFTLDDLKNLPSVSRIHFVECNGNGSPHFNGINPDSVQDAHGLTSCSEWTGVRLSVLLKEAGVQKGAHWVDAESADELRFTRSIPLDKAIDDVIVAYGQNGEATRTEQGYPVRLLVPGWVGSYNIKWLRRLKVVDQPEMGKWSTNMYTTLRPDGKRRWFDFEMPPKSIITRPSGGQRLASKGFYEITGLAWSGSGAIRRVEVSTDGGRTWKDAELQEPVLRKAHTRFCFPWTWNGEEAVIESRCTDELGEVQPTLDGFLKKYGITLDYLPSVNTHFNAIQPWKITPEGNVRNVMFS